MRLILVILVVFLIAKDTLPLGDRFVLRGIAQGLCLGYGLLWLLRYADPSRLLRYAPILAYACVLLLTAFVSSDPVRVVLQVGSLLSVFLFAIAAVESNLGAGDASGLMRTTTVLSYTVVCAGSILVIWLAPGIAYVTEGIAGGTRFSGLFSQPGMIGAASGLLLGLAFFGRLEGGGWTVPVRLLAVALALVCLALAGARTFWVAAGLALLLTYVFYGRRRLLGTAAATYVVVIALLAALATGLKVSERQVDRVLRTDSIATLTGRSALWQISAEQFSRRPVLGYGYTLGGTSLYLYEGRLDRGEGDYLNNLRASAVQTPSLHNGYIQAFLDSGALGGVIYVLLIGYGILRILRHDRDRRYGAELYVLLFMAVGNLGESLIYSASVFHSILFWYTLILALGLERQVAASGPYITQGPGQVARWR